jgi:hypothetical protein
MPRIIGVEKVIARLEGAVGEKAVRPYMGPATRRKKAEIIENVRKAVNRNLAKR